MTACIRQPEQRAYMADKDLYFSDSMFYDENIYRPEIRLDEDGFYRWRCTLDKVHDRGMYRFLIRFWAVFAVCGLVMGFLMAHVPPEMIRFCAENRSDGALPRWFGICRRQECIKHGKSDHDLR